MLMRKTLTLLILLAAAALSTYGQEAPEYRMEIGAGAGLVSYQGDFNGSILKNMQPMGTLLAKYRMNPRMAWAMNVSYGKLKGSSADVKTWYPELQEQTVSFNHGLVDVCLRYEYNFWAFGTGQEYRGARRLTPFITLGLGATYTHTDDGTFAANLPLGFGVKYKIGDRLNLTAEWVMHFTGSDRLDGISDPYGIKSSGLFKNADSYSVLQVALSYDIWAKCKTCNNDRDD